MDDQDELVSMADAAADCGMSVEEFIEVLVKDGMLIEHPNGGYVASPHPDIREL
jgi:hypothetical protein